MLVISPPLSASADSHALLGVVEQHQCGVYGLLGGDEHGREHGRLDHAREAHEELQRGGAVDHPVHDGLLPAGLDVLERGGEERPRVGDRLVHRTGHRLDQVDADADVVHVLCEDRERLDVLTEDLAGGLDTHGVGHLLAFSSTLAWEPPKLRACVFSNTQDEE